MHVRGSLPAMNERVALLIPGRGYSAQAPLLAYAGAAAGTRGASVRSLQWSAIPPTPDLPGKQRAAFVREQVGDQAVSLMIGKSLGTFAAVLAAERTTPAVWITPLLDDPIVMAALRAAAAPVLLVGGTADPSWDGPSARSLTPHVYEVDGADHGLFVAGPLAASAAVLGLVATAVERFLDTVSW